MNKVDGAADSLSKGGFALITAPKKKDQEANFYGNETGSSYIYDTYETHVEKVEVSTAVYRDRTTAAPPSLPHTTDY